MTMAMCSPDTDSRCASPESRMAARSAAGMALCPPVSSAAAMAPAAPGRAAVVLPSMAARSPARGALSAPGSTEARPMAKPLPPRPEKKAARWKSQAPG